MPEQLKIIIWLFTFSVLAKAEAPPKSGLDTVKGELQEIGAHSNTDTTLPYPSFKGVVYSLVPGVVLHGSGHYLTGRKKEGWAMLKWSGIGLGTTVGALGIMVASGGAGELMPVLIPASFWGFGTFMSTWVFDILGTAGIRGVQMPRHPFQESRLSFSYVEQDNNRNGLYHFITARGQIGFEIFFVGFSLERELNGVYHEIVISNGYRLWRKPAWQIYLIPEFKYKHSQEGFGITQGHMLADVELNLGAFWPSVNGLYMTNELGYGIEFFHLDGADVDFTNEIMIIGQGLRLYLSNYLDISSKYKRREDEQVGGRDHSLFYFEHSIRSRHRRLFGELQFTHGQGFRLNFSLGYAL